MGFTIDTIEQARALIGKRVVATRKETNSVVSVESSPSTGFRLWMDDGEFWGLPDSEVTFELVEPKLGETPAERVARLRAELVEAEAEAARVDGAPDGWSWRILKDQRIVLEGSELSSAFKIGFSMCPSHWIFVSRKDDPQARANIGHAPFYALAAFVDRVRRDRGETTPEVAAPVSEVPAASPGVPEGWDTERYLCGPCWTKGGTCIEVDMDGDVALKRGGNRIYVPPDVLRAFLAAMDS